MLRGIVNVSVANMYSEASYRGECISQAILGERITITDNEGDFSLIEAEDGYSGWISTYQWVTTQNVQNDEVFVRAHNTKLYVEPDVESNIVREAVLGTKLPQLNDNEKWQQVRLPDGIAAWLIKRDLGTLIGLKREEIIKVAEEFLGIPYFWGGKSPKGFDCSGLMQVIFGLAGVKLRRDSWMQHHDAKFISDDSTEAQPGDLYFFAEYGDKITHVGLALGDNRILHSRGYVRINSLTDGAGDFDPDLAKTFVDTRTFL